MNKIILERIQELHQLLGINRKIPTDPYDFNSYTVAHFVGFSTEQELKFLEILAEEDRQKIIINHLEKLMPLAKRVQEIKRKAMLNGHFRDLKPPRF